MEYTEFVETGAEDREAFAMLTRKGKGGELPVGVGSYYTTIPTAAYEEMQDTITVLSRKKRVEITPKAAAFLAGIAILLLVETEILPWFYGLPMVILCIAFYMCQDIPHKA